MSTIIADTYEFNSLEDWERFYLSHKEAIDAKDTRWLNKHITITDNGKYYKIKYRKKRLYLKPIIRIDPKETTADLTLHSLNLILTKLQEIDDRIIRDNTTHIPERTDSAPSLPNKSIIERVKTLSPNQT